MIRGGQSGKTRLDYLDLAYRSSTAALLERCGVGPGLRCLDLGCGGGHATRQLARAVGPSGSVVGVDTDVEILGLARRDTDAAGLSNVEFRDGNANELGEGSYDVVYARLLLTHLRDPAELVKRMAAATRPGGAVIVEDIDWDGAFCYPPSAAFDRYWRMHEALHRRRGGDPRVGPKLPGLLRAAGLRDVGLSVVQPVHQDGDAKLVHYLTLQNIAPAARDEGLLGEREADELLRDLGRLTEDPAVLLGLPRTFQVWGTTAVD